MSFIVQSYNAGGEHASCRLYWRSLAVTVMSLCSLSLASTATTSICPADVPQSAVANSNSDQFFLDIDHPIECNGTVMAWKICYYLLSGEGGEGGEDIEETLFSVTVGVWKISGAWYRLVNYRLVEELGRDLQPGFNCITFPLLTTEQFSVKPGHLIGFHTHSVDSFEEVLQLHAVASSGEKLTKRKDSGFCQFSYPGLPVSLSCFENVTGAMHVHVIVEEFEGKSTWLRSTK